MSAEPLPAPLAPGARGKSDLELVLTAPDEATQRTLAVVVTIVVKGAHILRSTAAPWQVRVTRGELDDAAWRERVKHLIEAY